MMGRAREFEDRGMLSRAEEEYQAVAIGFPGDMLSQAGLSRVQRVLSTRRENEKSRVNRETGLRNFRMSDYAGAERELSAAVDAGRTDTATLYALGMSYLKLGDHAKAEIFLDRCIAETPDYAPALVGLAEASAATGRRDKALSLLQRALELGGGAEFTPAKITDMISDLDPQRSAPSPSALSLPPPERSHPTFIARAIHSHDFLLASCKGDLEIVNSVVHFNASNPCHSFHVLVSEVSGAHINGGALHFRVGGKPYRFNLKGRPARDFLDALVR
jgi:tetratricopeptide (TPR) repeat protein